jgi:hypothetical protein
VKLPVSPTLRPSLSPIRTVVPSTFCLPALACSPRLIPSPTPNPPYATTSLSLLLCEAATRRDRRQSKQAENRCSLTAFRVCIRPLHISLRKTLHSGPSGYPGSGASLATWYALSLPSAFPSLYMLSCPHPLPCTRAHHSTRSGHDSTPLPCSTPCSALPYPW